VLEITGSNDLLSFDEFLAGALKSSPDLGIDEARRAYGELSTDERQPQDDDPFDVGDIGASCDGDWPAWPARGTLQWMPEDIQQQFGAIYGTVHNGDYLLLDPSQEAQIVAAPEGRGYRCTRDDEVVHLASPS
jgi:hypothetical protein